jgi:hypothetical protein
MNSQSGVRVDKMDDQEILLSWFLDNYFGLGMKSGELLRLLKKNKQQEQLLSVAWRIWFSDLLRYRLAVYPTKVVPNNLPGFLENEFVALNQYLLFTCIDGLVDNHFLTYPEWLNSSRKNKLKHHIDDEKISKLLPDNISSPDTFRSTAYRIYVSCYKPIYGNRTSINNFLVSLPEPVKKVMVEKFMVIQPPRKIDILVLDHDTGSPFDDTSEWERIKTSWRNESIGKRITDISEYLYNVTRNPYTHNAITADQKPHYHHHEFPKGEITLIYDYYEQNNKLIVYEQEGIEDKYLLIRMLVSIGWLTKLGIVIDENFVAKFRKHQVKRELIYISLREIDEIINISKLYQGTYISSTSYIGKWRLPYLDCAGLENLFSILNQDSPNRDSITSDIQTLLQALQNINLLVTSINKKHIPNKLALTKNEEKILELEMPREFEIVKDLIESVGIEQKCDDIADKFRTMADWMNT